MNAAEILKRIRELRALVVGDICLDRWCRYDPSTSEPSRETGIPRIAVVETEVTPGAAGTVANNLVALGAHDVAVLGVIGEDGFGFELRKALENGRISSTFTVESPDVPTFTYTKLINRDTGVEDRPRVDFIYTRPMPARVEEQVVARLRAAWPAFDVVLVSDQAETEYGGLITPLVREEISRLAAVTPDRVVWVDSRMRPEMFRNVIVKCNDAEADAACRRSGMTIEGVRGQIGSRPLIVTLGGDGALIVTADGTNVVPARPVANPVDICGAGDSFSAGAALAYAITASPVEAARFGNQVSSITIMKAGTGTASPEEVLEAERTWP